MHELVAMFIIIALSSTFVLCKRFYFNLYVPCTYLAFCYSENMCEMCVCVRIFIRIFILTYSIASFTLCSQCVEFSHPYSLQGENKRITLFHRLFSLSIVWSQIRGFLGYKNFKVWFKRL